MEIVHEGQRGFFLGERDPLTPDAVQDYAHLAHMRAGAGTQQEFDELLRISGEALAFSRVIRTFQKTHKTRLPGTDRGEGEPVATAPTGDELEDSGALGVARRVERALTHDPDPFRAAAAIVLEFARGYGKGAGDVG